MLVLKIFQIFMHFLIFSGLQEYIEALSFNFFLKTGQLIPLSDVQQRLTFMSSTSDSSEADMSASDTQEIKVLVPPSEYVLGIADLTGEMMRRAIHSVGDGDLNRPFEICSILQEMESAFTALTNCNREVNRKLTVLRQSLRKVESACYTLKVRGSEIPQHMLVDVISKAGSTSVFIDEATVEDD